MGEALSLERDAIRAHRIDVGRLTLNVRETGVGPLAIFLHGITSNAAVWDPILLQLRDRLRCVAVDQRGHGRSDKPESGYGAQDYSRDILALIETLNAGPAMIVGHSLGARNGVVAAALRPDLVRSVVAIDFTPYIETEVFDSLESRVNGGDRLFRDQREIEDYLQARYPKMPADAVRQRATTAYEQVEGGWRPLASPQAMAMTASGLREDLESFFKSVQVPMLVVRGRESKFVSAAAFEKTTKLRPDLPTLVVEGADHYVNEEAPDITVRSILSFASGD